MGGRGRPANEQRRRQVLILRRRGLTVAEVADQVGITHQAVSYYLRGLHTIACVPIACEECNRTIVRGSPALRRTRPAVCLECLKKRPDATFGQRLKAYRLAAGLTRVELIGRIGIDDENLRCYEAGTVLPREHTLVRLVRVLGPGLTDPPPPKPYSGKLAEPGDRRLRPVLRVEQILAWADTHRTRTGQWPRAMSGRIIDAPGDTWLAVDRALRHGHRGLAQEQARSLYRLLRKHGRR